MRSRSCWKKSMSILERREAVRFLVTRRVSVQRACVLVQLQRATFRYQPRPVANDGVAAELSALAQEQPRYGYRRITQRAPGAASAGTHHQSKARASLVEARRVAGQATKTPSAARVPPARSRMWLPSHPSTQVRDAVGNSHAHYTRTWGTGQASVPRVHTSGDRRVVPLSIPARRLTFLSLSTG
jgi:hypothetical protein